MIYKLFGWFWVITGIYFFLRPRVLIKKIQRKSKWQMRKWLFVLALLWGAPLFALGWSQEGFFSKLLFIIGILAVLKGLFFLTSRAASKIIEWSQKSPSFVFRLYAFVQVILGVVLLAVSKK
ncbi:MAG: hypothetical protein JW928_00395 [Candidatus Aureabacteria bacterium]|nr:hypothetical protein [Candidatus Auribacterota bacterium]